MSILPPSSTGIRGSIAWIHNASSDFTPDSAYKSFVATTWAESNIMWKHICCYCESILHILRDCPFTRTFWQTVLPLALHESFFSLSLGNWIMSNLIVLAPLIDIDVPWDLFFSSSLWQLWKYRNGFLFAEACLPIQEGYRIALAWGWLCLNTDDVVSTTSSLGIIGGLIRGSSGEWIEGYCKHIGLASLLLAELRTLYIGLQVAWNLGVEHLQIQSDSKQAIDQLLSIASTRPLPLVNIIVSLRSCAWCTEFQWVHRECNLVANSLSRLLTTHSFDLQFFEEASRSIVHLLDRDINGFPPSHSERV
ncbi:hypothetical protein V6N12_003323 [Hibiscus sabdariffa]|uniref:RNase H type-1 domain-containing protein n=1 Tax=Hibiscus sabdariffa TaxID=183260 RepID=A0ABR2EBN2_9ROSI